MSSMHQSFHTSQQDNDLLNDNVDWSLSREYALVALSDKTSYPILQENGQRCYGPPPNWYECKPPKGCEVFIGKIPRDCYEDELVPVFELVGKIYMFRLMMDFNGHNRGYGFCMYTNRNDAKRAVIELDCYEIRKGKMLGVCLSIDNCRLFIGGIPKTKSKDEIMFEMLKVTVGVSDVIVYPSAVDKAKNRGFAFVEYENHKAAAMARRKLIPGKIQLWGHQIAVDWAEPEHQVDEDIMSKVRILYVRNLMLHTTEDAVRDHFNHAINSLNAVERVKKIRDYAFVHFHERLRAIEALKQVNGSTLDGSIIEVTWAKPVNKNDHLKTNHNTQNILANNQNYNNPLITSSCLSLITRSNVLSLQSSISSSSCLFNPLNTFNTESRVLLPNLYANNTSLQYSNHATMYPIPSMRNQSSNSLHSLSTTSRLFKQSIVNENQNHFDALNKQNTDCNLSTSSFISSPTLSLVIPSLRSTSSGNLIHPLSTKEDSIITLMNSDIHNNKSINITSCMGLNEVASNEFHKLISSININEPIQREECSTNLLMKPEYSQSLQNQLNSLIMNTNVMISPPKVDSNILQKTIDMNKQKFTEKL
ncbi:hypothetical protein MN116_000419 [Schistosoma mekongi]|uniref:RRM domain-containing protein n=1 Tax=Schistosoma mekongi TaxID=38744 RepID=A0AAE2D5P2_SCHME|nr:hypothetical protein MN116_000419 [Schistosoma mekongi]